MMESDAEEGEGAVTYKTKYRQLKNRLKYLIYVSRYLMLQHYFYSMSSTIQEHECFENDIQKAQMKLLQLSRDKR